MRTMLFECISVQNAFSMPCNPPHPLIWAKIEGFNFWPTKIMSWTDQMVNARFFGDYQNAIVSSENCYLYSQDPPVEVEPMNTTMADEYKHCLLIF